MSQGAPVRILVVDDHPVVRSGLVSILNRQPGFEVVGEAADGAAAVSEYLRLRPDVLLLDLRLPVLDGWQVLAKVREADPQARVLAISTWGGDEDVHRALAAGAKGYLLKESTEEEIVAALEAVVRGGAKLSPGAAEAMAMRHQFEPLTAREAEVLAGLAKGESNKEIALRTGTAESTIKGHVANIMGKLGVDDRTAAVTVALRRGLLHLPSR